MRNQILIFWMKCVFDVHAKGRSSKDRNLRNNYYKKRAILASGLKDILLSVNARKICDRFKILLRYKRA